MSTYSVYFLGLVENSTSRELKERPSWKESSGSYQRIVNFNRNIATLNLQRPDEESGEELFGRLTIRQGPSNLQQPWVKVLYESRVSESPKGGTFFGDPAGDLEKDAEKVSKDWCEVLEPAAD